MDLARISARLWRGTHILAMRPSTKNLLLWTYQELNPELSNVPRTKIIIFVETPGVEPGIPQCECGVMPLYYVPIFWCGVKMPCYTV